MKLKRLAFLGTVAAGAAYLSNKERRDRLLHSASDLLSSARRRLDELDLRQRGKVEASEARAASTEPDGGGQPAAEAAPVTAEPLAGMPGAPMPRDA